MAITDKLTAIADAIREKTGKTALLTLDEMPAEIRSITGGGSVTPIVKPTKGVVAKTLSATSNSITFDVDGEPLFFTCIIKANLGSQSTNKVMNVVSNNGVLSGQYLKSNTTTYSETAFTHSYDNGQLTITSSNGDFAAVNYELRYVYGAQPTVVRKTLTDIGNGRTSVTFNAVVQPEFFIVQLNGNVGASVYTHRVGAVMYDGDVSTSGFGWEFTNQTYYRTNWLLNWNNGNLTIASSSASNGGYFHSPATYELLAVYLDTDIEALQIRMDEIYNTNLQKEFEDVSPKETQIYAPIE